MTSPSSMPSGPATESPLLGSIRDTIRRLRAALIELYASVGADPATPQEVSRQFGVTKSQAWKLSKVMHSVDPVEAARHVPGRQGFERVLQALGKGGAPAARVNGARQAVEAFHELVSTHAGDRASFELTLDSMRAESEEPGAMESARKQAFLGNSATWGIRARLQLGLRVVVPSAEDEDLLSCANVTGLVDLRRLRSATRWPLAQYAMRYIGVEGPKQRQAEPLDPQWQGPEQPPFLVDFCSQPLPSTRSNVTGQTIRYELDEGPVGKAAALSCLMGMRFRRFASMYAAEPGEYAEHSALFTTPVEVAVIDLLVHRDLPFELPPVPRLYSRLDTEAQLTADRDARVPLPLAETLEPLGSGPPVLATPHHTRHQELVEWVVGRLGRSLDEFTGYRVVLRYPPIPTMLSLEHPLLER